MIIPVTFFGISCALAVGENTTTKEHLTSATVAKRIPETFLWVSMNVFVFSISNQRSEKSVLEDSINKPWRPIPSGRIDRIQVRRLLLAMVPAIYAIAYFYLGAPKETLLCLLLTWMYNDLGGADEHFVIRNLINGIAYFVYCSGAFRVACGHEQEKDIVQIYSWVAYIAGIIFTTMQVQDLKDQAGDRASNRHTAPLILGDSTARWTIAVGVMIWSFVCPLYWKSNTIGFVAPITIGLWVTLRVLSFRNPRADRITYQAWSVWLMALFTLPLIKHHDAGKVLISMVRWLG